MARLILRSRTILSTLIIADSKFGSIFPVIVQGIRKANRVVWYSSKASDEAPAKQKISKAMKAYLQRAKEHDDFIREQLLQYNVGKRHLANMMGEDPETFTQEDIDKAIEYLFPSGLFEPKARPMMKPPEEIFPPKKAAEFDESGRPHHFLFYTGKPNYYQLLYDVVENLEFLNDFEDKMIRKHLTPESNQALNMLGTNWLSLEDLQLVLVETIGEREYENFKLAMDRLLQHPYSYKVKDFIEKYRKAIMSRGKTFDIPKPQYDADGRAFVTTKPTKMRRISSPNTSGRKQHLGEHHEIRQWITADDGECARKASRGEVTLRVPGTGKFTINNKGIEYFESVQDREQPESGGVKEHVTNKTRSKS